MASKSCASAALFLALNLLFFSLVSACGTCPNRPGTNPNNPGRNPNNPGTNPNNPGRNPNNPGTSPNNPGTNPNNPGTNPNNPGNNPNNPGTNPNNPGNNPVPTPAARGRCPRDALKLGVCANLLGGAIGVIIGTPPQLPCCTLLQGLVDLEAAICLCTAIRANILGLNLNLPISLSLILNSCGRRVPTGFQC